MEYLPSSPELIEPNLTNYDMNVKYTTEIWSNWIKYGQRHVFSHSLYSLHIQNHRSSSEFYGLPYCVNCPLKNIALWKCIIMYSLFNRPESPIPTCPEEQHCANQSKSIFTGLTEVTVVETAAIGLVVLSAVITLDILGNMLFHCLTKNSLGNIF